MKGPSDPHPEPLQLSRLFLPKLADPPATILAHLIEHFPQVGADAWGDRVVRGLVTVDDGTVITADTPYRYGTTVRYGKEVDSEPPVTEEETVLYRDEEILVVDKPHGMVVTPAGDHVERSLLVRLQRRTGLASLVPAHRLDRDTVGVILFSLNSETRSHYHRLFAEGQINREYLAVAHLVGSPEGNRWRVRNRLEAGEPWFRQKIVDGEANAVTDIELVEEREGLGFFRIRPESGKKHQIRVHMASIGCPIVGDRLYPEVRDTEDDEPRLQLLAHRLEFVDPVNESLRRFVSARELDWP